MISEDPKLPQLTARELGESYLTLRWAKDFIRRFYELWREWAGEFRKLTTRVVTLEDFDFAAGTYTPTLTNTTNVAASTAYACQYLRVGNTITVSGKFDIDVTAAGADTVLGISLPVASALTQEEQLGGVAARVLNGVDTAVGYIKADATNDRAYFGYYHASGAVNYSWFFTFTYQVL